MEDNVAPPPPSTVEEFYEGADAKILSAGYHEGATYFELPVLQQKVSNVMAYLLLMWMMVY